MHMHMHMYMYMCMYYRSTCRAVRLFLELRYMGLFLPTLRDFPICRVSQSTRGGCARAALPKLCPLLARTPPLGGARHGRARHTYKSSGLTRVSSPGPTYLPTEHARNNTHTDTHTRARALSLTHTARHLYSHGCLSKSILSKPVPSRAQLSRAAGPAGVPDRWGPPPE